MLNESDMEGIALAGQPSDAELATLAERGFTTVVNVRPPEELDEPEAPKIPAGVTYHEIGFTAATLDRDHVRRVREALDQAPPGKVLVHCAGATRAAVVTAVVLAEREKSGADGALRKAAAAGFELDGTPYAAFIRRYFA